MKNCIQILFEFLFGKKHTVGHARQPSQFASHLSIKRQQQGSVQ